MKINPIGNRILLKQEKEETVTNSGIVIPDSVTKEKPIIGEVIEIGNGDKIKNINVGDRVIYEKYSAVEVKDGDTVYLLVEMKSILAKIS